MTIAERGADGLWAITTFFNPVGYRRRLQNYRLFRERLPLPLLTVELGYHPEFELGAGDADRLIQLRGTDVMWQKERLLNIGLQALPKSCVKVLWTDCDVAFEGADWVERVNSLLDQYVAVQLFDKALMLRRGSLPEDLPKPVAEVTQTSFVCAIARGEPEDTVLPGGMDRVNGSYAAGLAWAARRELLDEHGLYDAAIIGGGDTAMACAAFGRFDIAIDVHRMTDHQRARYLRWAEPFHKSVGGAIGHRDGNLFHFWHGESTNRRWRERHEGLSSFAFDPDRDIARDSNGVWRWATDKPELHGYLRDYFAGRREDG